MHYLTTILILLFSSVLFIPNMLWSKEGNNTPNKYRIQSGWSTSVRGGNLYQFATELDNGRSYSSARYNLQGSRNYSWDSRTSASIAVSYSYDDYNFSAGNSDSLAGSSPWNNIHSFSLSTPLRKGINDRWSAFIIPSLRFTGETGAEFDKTITSGLFAAAAYRFSENLTIGPGLGVVSQLQESVSIFPVLIIKWNITDKLSFATGSGLAATQGPGLTLRYKADQKSQYAVGGYYEKLRFRLDKSGDVADGIGEDSSFPLFASYTYNLNPKIKVDVVAGMELGGQLKVENSKGEGIFEESSAPGFLGGLNFNMRL